VEQTVGFASVGGELRDELGRCDADRAGDPDLSGDVMPDLLRDRFRGAEQEDGAGDI